MTKPKLKHPKSAQLVIRVTQPERKNMEKAAKRYGYPLATACRRALRQYAKEAGFVSKDFDNAY